MSGSVTSEASPAWSINPNTDLDYPVLVGDNKNSLEYNPIKPVHARTPFNPPIVSGFGRQPLSAEIGRLKSEPASSFYGPYGDTWSMDQVAKVRGERGSKKHGVWGVAMGGQGVTERPPGPATPGPGAHNLLKDNVDQSMGKQALSHRFTEPAIGISPANALGDARTARLEKQLEIIQFPKPTIYEVGPTQTLDGAGRPGLAVSDAFNITNSTFGVQTIASDTKNEPSFSFARRSVKTEFKTPGPGAYKYDSYTTLSGDQPFVSETTLGRTNTRKSAPVAVLSNRGPRHPSRSTRKDEVVEDKEDYRTHPDRWTRRTVYKGKEQLPTELTSQIFSSFGKPYRSSEKSSPKFTIRQLHVDQSYKKTNGGQSPRSP